MLLAVFQSKFCKHVRLTNVIVAIQGTPWRNIANVLHKTLKLPLIIYLLLTCRLSSLFLSLAFIYTVHTGWGKNPLPLPKVNNSFVIGCLIVYFLGRILEHVQFVYQRIFSYLKNWKCYGQMKKKNNYFNENQLKYNSNF